MMRYVLYESGSETISLKKDIQFIENYIELMRIRYDSSIDICLDYPATIPNKVAIPPLLLIVFVENAFKHGVSYNHASFIHIRIGYRDDAVTAVISNSRHEKSRPGTTGIGLENVKKTAGIDLPGQLYALNRRFRSGRLYRQTHNPHHAMLKCIAIDDEPLALRQLQGYIAKINFLKLEKSIHQRHRSPAISSRESDRPDFRGYQHARPERCGVRTFARQPPDDYLHDGLFGIRRRGIQTRCDRLPAQTVQLR